MRGLGLTLALVAQLAAAQVAGVCGPGKNCAARNFVSTPANQANAYCVNDGATYSAAWRSFTTGQYGWHAFTGQNCNAANIIGGTPPVLMNIVSGSMNLPNAGWFYSAAAGYSASLAFASFPSCTAGLAGRLIYDSTNAAWRYCDGAGTWLFVLNGSTSAASVDVYSWSAQQGTGGETVNANWLGPYRTGNTGSSLRGAVCNWQATGTGGTTGVTLQVYNVTDSVALCSLGSVSCTTGARVPFTLGGCSGTAVAANKTYVVRVSASDCTTQPTGTVCSIEGLRQP